MNPKFPCTAALPDGKVCDSVSTTNKEETTMVATGVTTLHEAETTVFFLFLAKLWVQKTKV